MEEKTIYHVLSIKLKNGKKSFGILSLPENDGPKASLNFTELAYQNQKTTVIKLLRSFENERLAEHHVQLAKDDEDARLNIKEAQEARKAAKNAQTIVQDV